MHGYWLNDSKGLQFQSQKDNFLGHAPISLKVPMLCIVHVHISIRVRSYVDSLMLLAVPEFTMGLLLQKFNSSINIISNHVRSHVATGECKRHGIASLFQDFQQTSRPQWFFPEVIKAANKIIKRASEKGRTKPSSGPYRQFADIQCADNQYQAPSSSKNFTNISFVKHLNEGNYLMVCQQGYHTIFVTSTLVGCTRKTM